MNNNWKHIKTIVDSEPFELNGLNIWDFQWERTGNYIKIKDPNYGQEYSFSVYKIVSDKIEIQFAAGEYSNCIWGIYLKNE